MPQVSLENPRLFRVSGGRVVSLHLSNSGKCNKNCCKSARRTNGEQTTRARAPAGNVSRLRVPNADPLHIPLPPVNLVWWSSTSADFGRRLFCPLSANYLCHMRDSKHTCPPLNSNWQCNQSRQQKIDAYIGGERERERERQREWEEGE